MQDSAELLQQVAVVKETLKAARKGRSELEKERRRETVALT